MHRFFFRITCILCLAIVCDVLMLNAASQAQSPPPTASVQWRRTVNGWERADLWEVGSLSGDASDGGEQKPTEPLPRTHIHPIFIAGFMFAAAGLMAVGAGSARTKT